MPVKHSEIKRILAFALILILLVLAFLVVKPILLSIVGGLILAYAFNPVYLRVRKFVKNRNASALIVGLLIVLIIFIPLWFLIPLLIKQVINTFNGLQGLDVASFVQSILPIDSSQIQFDITNAILSFIGKMTTASLTALTNFLLDIPTILLNLAVVIFVFFFTLRDQEKLKEFILGISPIKREEGKKLVKQFKEVTSSIIFGFIVVGVIQGIATGIGLLVFGVPNALVLTIFAILAAIIPIIGPWLIWVPAAIYLLFIGKTTSAIIFALYGGLIISTMDNFLRPLIVSRRSNASSLIVLIGMIGGLFVFGVIGLILGPLVLSYLILFLEAYKNKTLSDMFSSE